MLSKFRILLLLHHHHLTHRLSPTTITRRTANLFSPTITTLRDNTSHFCTAVNSSQLTPESPEIPSWVMFSDNPTPDDGDFVIPSLAHWVDSSILETKPKAKLFVKPNLEENLHLEDVEKIIDVLMERHLLPELVAATLNAHCFEFSGFGGSLVMQILKRFSNDWIPALGFFNWAKTQTPYAHSPEQYNLMVDILGKFKEFDVMWDLLKEMKGLEGYVTLDTMTKVMRRLAKGGKPEDAVEAFRRLDEFDVEKDTVALNNLLDALVKGHNIELAHDALYEFKNSVPLNSPSFNILIHGWCKNRNSEKAREVMEDKKKHGFEPDVFSYSNFIEIYSHYKDFRKVDQVLEEMKRNGCAPNAVTYTNFLLAYGKAGQFNKALEAYEEMKKDGIVADAPFYSSLLVILGKAGRLKDACHVFEDMPKQGVVRNVATYNAMIAAACAHSKEETALRLLKEMEETSCKPDIQTYHPLIKMCCQKKRMKVLKFLLDHMLKNDLSLDLGTYTLLVHSLCKTGKLVEACTFFEEMVLKGFTPIQSTRERLLGKLESVSMLKEKDRVEELMARAQDVVRDVVTYNAMIAAACAQSKEETALRLLKEMEETSCKPDNHTYHPLIKMCCKKKRMELLKFLLDHMLKNDLSLDPGTYTLLVHSFCKTDKVVEACAFFEEMVLKGFTPMQSTVDRLLRKLESESMLKEKDRVEELMARVQGVVRDVVTYNIMITAACAQSKEETALRLLKEMEETSCKPDIHTYNPLIKMCCKKKRMELLKFLLDHMLKNDLSLDLETYTLLVHSLCKTDKLVEACAFFEEMLLKGFTPSQSTVKRLLGKLESESMLKEIDHVEELMASAQGKQNI